MTSSFSVVVAWAKHAKNTSSVIFTLVSIACRFGIKETTLIIWVVSFLSNGCPVSSE